MMFTRLEVFAALLALRRARRRRITGLAERHMKRLSAAASAFVAMARQQARQCVVPGNR